MANTSEHRFKRIFLRPNCNPNSPTIAILSVLDCSVRQTRAKFNRSPYLFVEGILYETLLSGCRFRDSSIISLREHVVVSIPAEHLVLQSLLLGSVSRTFYGIDCKRSSRKVSGGDASVAGSNCFLWKEVQMRGNGEDDQNWISAVN